MAISFDSLVYRVVQAPSDLRAPTRLEFQIDSNAVSLIKSFLEELRSSRKDTRMRLSENDGQSWMLFWKIHATQNRTVLAHPDENEWVGSVILKEETILSLENALENSEDFALNQLGRLDRVSNLCIEFKRS